MTNTLEARIRHGMKRKSFYESIYGEHQYEREELKKYLNQRVRCVARVVDKKEQVFVIREVMINDDITLDHLHITSPENENFLEKALQRKQKISFKGYVGYYKRAKSNRIIYGLRLLSDFRNAQPSVLENILIGTRDFWDLVETDFHRYSNKQPYHNIRTINLRPFSQQDYSILNDYRLLPTPILKTYEIYLQVAIKEYFGANHFLKDYSAKYYNKTPEEFSITDLMVFSKYMTADWKKIPSNYDVIMAESEKIESMLKSSSIFKEIKHLIDDSISQIQRLEGKYGQFIPVDLIDYGYHQLVHCPLSLVGEQSLLIVDTVVRHDKILTTQSNRVLLKELSDCDVEQTSLLLYSPIRQVLFEEIK